MSEIQVGQINSTDGSTAITTGADGYVSFAKTQIGGRRNLIINGAMQVAQRGDSTGVTDTGYYGPDRWQAVVGGGTYSISQAADGPNGFATSYKIQCTTADGTLGSGDIVGISQKIEGLNLQSIAKGTSDAQELSWSFWVKSNMTGTYQTNIREKDNTRLVGATYTINSADTWEKKTITFPADTTGAINNDNGESMQIEFFLRAGSTYSSGAVPTTWRAASNNDRGAGLTVDIGSSTSNYWQITGVQLEVGTVATPFEHRSYGEELLACQRYLNIMRQNGSDSNIRYCSGVCASATAGEMAYVIYPELRSTPALSVAAAANYRVRSDGARTCTSVGSDNRHKNGVNIQTTVSGGQTSGFGANLDATSSSSFIELDAEL